MAAAPMRVMLVIDSFSGGGAERHVADLAGGLVSRGYEVLVGASASGSLLDEVRVAASDVSVAGVVPVKRRADDGYARWLRAQMIQFRPDVLHAHLFASEVAALRAAGRVPLVVTEHTEAPWQGERERRWSGHVFTRADVVVAVSSAILRRVVNEFGVAHAKVRRIVPMVSEPDGRCGAVPRPPTRKLVGCVARLERSKGVDLLVRAIGSLRERGVDVGLCIIGEGPEMAALRQLVSGLRLGGAVTFVGWLAEARRVLPCFDVLAVPSRHDGTPLVIAEAMVAGVPVVASDIGGLPDRITHGRDGILVPPGDVGALVDALDLVLGSDRLAHRLSWFGRQRARRHRFGTMLDEIEEVFDTAIERRSGRSMAG